MKGLTDRVGRIEATVDLLATKGKNLFDNKNNFKTAFNTADAKNGYEMRPEFTSSFASSDNRREARAAYTPPQSGIFGGRDDQTIIVKGFDFCLPEFHIKSLLTHYFSSCGVVISVVIPTDQETGAAIGCAYIRLMEGVENALKLSGTYLRGWKLVVEKATPLSDVGGRFDPSGRGGGWAYPYRCNGLGHCSTC
ncbi:unnamed protein product [Arabis nemorensis]|uniref:RRM domain-containing protein n=1 Tax=Arabis nemorensis TaxID=586526 RepID=A0A565B097_9BRAS|nr:unnamed protein product [Arabis nemorensis]